MSLTQLLLVLRARWKASLIVFLLIVGLTLIVSLVLPKQYRANASVVIDMKPDPIAGMVFGAMVPAYVATQIDVIRSERVAQRVIKNLKLAESPQIREQFLSETAGGSIEQWLTELLQKNLDVVPSKESSVIIVSYTNPDPRFAAAMANAFVQAYLDTTLDLKVDPARQYSGFFGARAKVAREQLEELQNKYSAFQKANGIIASDERLDVESARLSELSSQLVMIQAISAESASRQTQAAGSSGDRMQEVLNNAVISGLKSEVARGEAQLQQLSQRLGDSHPQVVEAKANLAELRLKIDAETKKVTGGVGVTNTINRQREADIRASLETQRAKVLRMKAVRDEGVVLARDVENAQRLYDQVLARLNQTSLESQSTQSNVYQLTEASPPVLSSSPRPVLNTLIAALIGLVLAVAIALVLELLDRRVRTADDIVELLGVPVIGVLPNPVRRPFGRTFGAPLLEQRVLGQLPSANRGA